MYEIAELYKFADSFVLPSLADTLTEYTSLLTAMVINIFTVILLENHILIF